MCLMLMHIKNKQKAGNDMGELKPCPFCGQEVTIQSTSATKSFVISHVGLRNCAFYKFEMSWEVGETLKNATTLWNRRAEQ